MQSAIEERICTVSYLKKSSKQDYVVQFSDISASFGQWYATGYNFKTERTQVFRCDKVLSLKVCKEYEPKPFANLAKLPNILYRTETATDFNVEVNQKGVDIFQKEHYPSMKLVCENEQYFICDFYNQEEENFIASYFIGYGESILSVQPKELSMLILKKIDSLYLHFQSL